MALTGLADPDISYDIPSDSDEGDFEEDRASVDSDLTALSSSPVKPTGTPALEGGAASSSSSDEDDEDDGPTLEELWAAHFKPGERERLLDELREEGLYRFLNKYLCMLDAYGDEVWPEERLLLIFGVVVPQRTKEEREDDSEQRAREKAALQNLLKISCSKLLRNRAPASLPQGRTAESVVQLLRQSKRVLLLTGAGVSTSCGIPDFRSSDGVYARLKEQYEDLEDPQMMFDISVFRERPELFYSFAKEIYPSNFVPSPCHRFCKLLQDQDKLLRNYTQNIDGLFEEAGVSPSNLLNCHGSFASATCQKCQTTFPGNAIQDAVFQCCVPVCGGCRESYQAEKAKDKKGKGKGKPKAKKGRNPWDVDEEEDDVEPEEDKYAGGAVVKPDIVFFGEKLSDDFDKNLLRDRDKVDLLIVMGTSLRVAPVSQLVSHVPHSVPQVLINRDPISHHTFDVQLLGDADLIVQWLLSKLRSDDQSAAAASPWVLPPPKSGEDKQFTPWLGEPKAIGDSGCWTFPGINEENRYLRLLQQQAAVGVNDDDDESDDGTERGAQDAGGESSTGQGTAKTSRTSLSDDEDQGPERKKLKPELSAEL